MCLCVYTGSGFPGDERRGGGVLCHPNPAEHSYQFRPHSGPERGASLHHDSEHGICECKDPDKDCVFHASCVNKLVKLQRNHLNSLVSAPIPFSSSTVSQLTGLF